MSDFIVKAKVPKYKQVSKYGMNVRMRQQDYIDLANVCTEANVRFCDLLHSVVRYAMDNLKIIYEGDEKEVDIGRDSQERQALLDPDGGCRGVQL